MINRKRNRKHFFTLIPLVSLFIILITILFSFNIGEFNYDWKDIRINLKDSIIGYEEASFYNDIEDIEKRNWIMNYASESELIKLKEHPSGNIKVIAYQGLLKNKNYTKKYELFLESLQFTNSVYYTQGCIGEGKNFNEYFLNNILGISTNRNVPIRTFDYGFSEEQKVVFVKEYDKISNENYNKYFKLLNTEH